jgi:hypothetical protein
MMNSSIRTHFETNGGAITTSDVAIVNAAQVAAWKDEAEKAGRRFLEDTVVFQFRHGGLSAGVAQFLSAVAKTKGESR